MPRISEQIFFSLQGQWYLERSINGHGHMKGMASFSLLDGDPLTLFYREEGEHTLQDGPSFSFFREYIYQLHNDYIDVYFVHDKKRNGLFHRLMFSENVKGCSAAGEHCCGQDLYHATYQFFNSGRFTLQYKVHGPKKNLTIQTLFQRQAFTHLGSTLAT